MNKSGGKHILVLDFGNFLLHDEGVDIKTLNHFKARCGFPANFVLFDGGVLGIKQTGARMRSGGILTIDVAFGAANRGRSTALDETPSPVISNKRMQCTSLNLMKSWACRRCRAHGQDDQDRVGRAWGVGSAGIS